MNPPTFLLPGWCLGQGPLRALASTLDACLLDLPGYGKAPLAPSFDAAVDQIADSLPDACALGGWSLGAMLALAVAARRPGKVDRLLLIAGTASFVARPGWQHAMAPAELAAFSAAAIADIDAALPRFVANFCRGDGRARAVMRACLDLADPRPSGATCGATFAATLATGLAWLRDADLRAEARAVACPTLLLHGAADPLMPLAAAESLTGLLPDARLVALPGTAHAPFLSDPERTIRAAAAFLR